MEKYKIKQVYPWQKENAFELEIVSKNLIYAELGNSHSGCQVVNPSNQKLIHEKCRKVADLIREIDRLNQ